MATGVGRVGWPKNPLSVDSPRIVLAAGQRIKQKGAVELA
jgi:hypothetical protein